MYVVDCRFPLYAGGGDQHRFDYAVFLLNKDIEQVTLDLNGLMIVNELTNTACNGFKIDVGQSQIFVVIFNSYNVCNVTASPRTSETDRGSSREKGSWGI
jgi:hypothetical protein